MTLTKEKTKEAILPHGGELVQREVIGSRRETLVNEVHRLKTLTLDAWSLSDLELIAIGGFSPLTGFMG